MRPLLIPTSFSPTRRLGRPGTVPPSAAWNAAVATTVTDAICMGKRIEREKLARLKLAGTSCPVPNRPQQATMATEGILKQFSEPNQRTGAGEFGLWADVSHGGGDAIDP
jgi:hypothetical protein